MGSNVNSPWTEERVADLVRLWSHGYSCSQIAAVIGVTRNAVIGKAHRLELESHGNNINSQKRSIDPMPPATPRTPPKNRRPQTVFASRERKPKAIVINAKPALTTVFSILTGAATTVTRRRTSLDHAMTKDELRAMLTAAVQNTAAMEAP